MGKENKDTYCEEEFRSIDGNKNYVMFYLFISVILGLVGIGFLIGSMVSSTKNEESSAEMTQQVIVTESTEKGGGSYE